MRSPDEPSDTPGAADAKRCAQAETKLQAILATAHDGILISRLSDGLIEDASDALIRQAGFTREEVLGKTVLELGLYPDPSVRHRVIAAARREGKLDNYPLTIRLKNGELVELILSVSVIDLDGEPHLLSVTRSITAQKRAEEALQETEKRYRAIYENSPAGITRVSFGDWRILSVNPAICRMLGYSEQELLGKTVLSITHPDDVRLDDEAVKKREEGDHAPIHFEKRFVRKDGSIMWGALVTAILKDDEGRPESALGILLDTTERKRIETERHEIELRRRQMMKMESLNVMAGAIAHNFNNLLMTVLGNLDLLEEDAPKDTSLGGFLSEAQKAARRASDLSRQMLVYVGQGRFQNKTFNLRELIEELRATIEEKISGRGRLEMALPKDDIFVEGDSEQLRQATMNVVDNAIEALPDSGGCVILGLTTKRVKARELSGPSVIDTLPEGNYAIIRVTDNGSGMDEATLSSVFDPFFTTRFHGRGLGLPTALGIARGHGGTIQITSSPGAGAVAQIMLPAVDVRKNAHPTGDDEGDESFVLMIEDDESIQRLNRHCLERAGFQVLEAVDGKEGLKVFTQNAGKVSCVLMDLIMPVMDGEQAMEEIRAIDPKVPIILSSGYKRDEIERRFAGKRLDGVLYKPYSADDLLKELNRVMDAKDPGAK